MSIGEKDFASTIDKLKRNDYQYASAGDVRRLVEEIDRCHARLEIDRVYVVDKTQPDGFKRKDLPYSERLRMPDGISARDETIKILEDTPCTE